jgi:chemotaxis signal transduction protein
MVEDDAAGRRLMDQRARALARPLVLGHETPADSLELACFSLGGEELAIETRFVLKVAPLPPLEPIPWSPPHYLGVVNYQGTVLPVVALPRVLVSAPKESAPEQMLVLGRGLAELAIAIDAASDVVQVSAGAIVAPTALPAQDPLLFGILEGRRVVLRGDMLLGDSRLLSAGESHATDDR